MAKVRIDRDDVRRLVRSLRKDDLLVLLERAICLVPRTRLAALVEGYFEPAGSCRDEPAGEDLLCEVQGFSAESLRGVYHESFAVNSKNWMRKSEGTKRWIAECNRLLDRCIAQARRGVSGVRESFDLLFALLRHLDDGRDDIVFFADEAGSWQVGVAWEKVLPAWFSCLAPGAEPDEHVREVVANVDAFVRYDRERYLRAARRAATPAQKRALAGA